MLAPSLAESSSAVPHQAVIADTNACSRALPMCVHPLLSVAIRSVDRPLLHPNRRLRTKS
eukprot:3654283-Pleurochrysis_carterae.AAC.1